MSNFAEMALKRNHYFILSKTLAVNINIKSTESLFTCLVSPS